MRKNERKEGGKKNTIISLKWISAFNICLVTVTCLSKWESERERKNTIGCAIQVKVKDVHDGAWFEAEESVHVW